MKLTDLFNFICNSNLSSIVLTIISIILAYLAYKQDRRAMKLQVKLAEFGGVFDKPDLEILLYNQPLKVRYYIFLPFINEGIFQFPFRFSITNTGKNRARNVEFSVKGSTNIIPNENMDFIITESSFSKFKYKVINNTPNITTLVFHSDYIEQNTIVQYTLETILSESSDNIYTDTFETKDNKLLNVKYRLGFAYLVDLWLTAENHSPVTKQMEFVLIDNSNESILDYFKSESEDNYKKHQEMFKKLSPFKKLKYFLSRDNSLMPKLKDIRIIYLKDHEGIKDTINIIKNISIAQGIIGSDGFLFLPFLNYNGYPPKKKIVYRYIRLYTNWILESITILIFTSDNIFLAIMPPISLIFHF